MATIELTKETFNDTITSNDTVLVDFWAEWCGPCRQFAPTYEAMSEKYPDIVFGKVDTEAEQELGGAFGIRSIPTLMVFREQVMLYSEAGALPASALESLIEQINDLDMEDIHRQVAEAQAAEDQSADAQAQHQH